MAITAQITPLKLGYKQTEVGVIPEDWEAKTIGDLVTFSGGSQPPRSTFIFQNKAGYIRLIQIRDYKTDEFETYIPEGLAQKKCLANDIMIGRYGPPIFQILRGIEGAYNVALIKAISSTRIDTEYLYHFLKQETLFHYVESLSQRSSGQTGIEMPALKSYPLPLPPLPEQRAIAAALSDVDALIASLDSLIAKKRDIKRATIQQLLTGKTRLPGFGGEWVSKVLKSVTQIPVTDGPHLTPRFLQEGIPFLSVNNIVDSKINLSDLRYVSKEDHTVFSKKCKPQKNDILLGKAASVGKVAIVDLDIEFNIWSPLALIRINEANIAKFVYYCLQSQSVTQQIEVLTNSSSQGNLGMGDIERLILLLPPKEEQLAIAEVLSDMDAEIDALEQKRDKTRALKQGMMQELLTGRIRLV